MLNSVARERLNARRVELAFDREKEVIRIKGVNDGGMEIKKTKLFGKGFFTQFNITIKGKFEAEYDPDENALFVQIYKSINTIQQEAIDKTNEHFNSKDDQNKEIKKGDYSPNIHKKKLKLCWECVSYNKRSKYCQVKNKKIKVNEANKCNRYTKFYIKIYRGGGCSPK